ncbi:SRPBCC family protein [Fodinibius sp.]|uniref:SRPBCC family protein n=1 Tax=Fodinibius sp. TaxID=1872440 RepID=UPI002ACE2902|nr:SRPBCC family protein [Fodinibius sp.]MDZ7659013.1 SRPBCC family protein [Fodinibius sp.]
MQKVKVSGTINAPVEKVWELASNFGELNQIVEGVSDCTIEGNGVGAVRTLTLQDGGKVKEKLESLDKAKRVLKYSILDSPMPIQNYTGTMQVDELEDGRSKFSWSSTFDAADGMEDDMKEALEGLYNLGVKGLQQRFSG